MLVVEIVDDVALSVLSELDEVELEGFATVERIGALLGISHTENIA